MHTPLSDPDFIKDYEDKFVLIDGIGYVLEIALSYGFKKAIHINELASLFPKAVD